MKHRRNRRLQHRKTKIDAIQWRAGRIGRSVTVKLPHSCQHVIAEPARAAEANSVKECGSSGYFFEGLTIMTAELKKTYFIILIPSLLGFIIVYGAKAHDFLQINRMENMGILELAIFILCAEWALALPLFYRSHFAHQKRDQKMVSEADFIKFERRLITISLVTPYLALVAYVLEFSKFYTTAAILMGLYAIYYFFPSKKRLAFDRRIFRVSGSSLQDI